MTPLPRLNLLVLRVQDLEKAVALYRAIGLTFRPEQHGSGPIHYSANLAGLILELYPRTAQMPSSSGTRLGFTVDTLDQRLAELTRLGAKVLTPPQASPWGRRAVVQDGDRHTIELIESEQ
ncbi:MAG: VOC family protein [Cyanobacteria bacterium P01_G01_bin.54]